MEYKVGMKLYAVVATFGKDTQYYVEQTTITKVTHKMLKIKGGSHAWGYRHQVWQTEVLHITPGAAIAYYQGVLKERVEDMRKHIECAQATLEDFNTKVALGQVGLPTPSPDNPEDL